MIECALIWCLLAGVLAWGWSRFMMRASEDR